MGAIFRIKTKYGTRNNNEPKMTHYYLGIDIGGTKSHALIADEHGQAVGFGQAGPGNWESVGWDETRRVIHHITAQALASAGLGRTDISGAGFGIGGYDWPEDRAQHVAIIESLSLPCPFIAGNDTLIALMAGASEGWGVVVIAGTSNNALGRDRQGRLGRMVGSSWFGEFAGAGEIMHRAQQAVAAAWTRRGPETQLTPAFVAATGAADVEDMLAGLMRNRYDLGARHAPLVFAIADSGDEVAREIIRWAGRELGSLACGIIRQLGFEQIEFELVQAGSIYKGSPLLTAAMHETVLALAPHTRFVRLEASPVVGGVLLGMEAAGVRFDHVRERLIDSVQTFLTPDPDSSS